MHNIINKIIGITIVVLIFLLGIIVVSNTYLKKREYSKKFFYMDTYIYVKIYSNNSKKAEKILNEVEDIYKEYHKLTDRYKSYNNVKNIYYIKNNKSNDEYIEIDKKLYDVIEYGLKYKEKTNGLIDIEMGNVIDVWKSYRDMLGGLPSDSELKLANLNKKEIVLKNNKILNNHPNIDLGVIAKGYTTQIVGEYLEKKHIKEYLINAGGNVLVGKNINKKEYTIGIENPDVENDIFDIVKCHNMAVVTSGGYQRYYEYNGKRYSHIISPKTLYPTNYMKSVTVITKNSAYADILSTYLYLLPIEDGIKYVDKIKGVEAIWYTNDGKIKYSSNAKKYEYKN